MMVRNVASFSHFFNDKSILSLFSLYRKSGSLNSEFTFVKNWSMFNGSRFISFNHEKNT